MARQDYDDEYGNEQPAYEDEHPYYDDAIPDVPQPDLAAALPSVGDSGSSQADPWAGVNLGKATKEQAEDFIRRNPGDYDRIASAFADDNQPKGPSGPSGGGGFGGGFSGPGDFGQYYNQLFGGLQGQFQSYMDKLSQQQQEDKARRQAYEDQVREAIMGLMNQQPLTADQIATGPEARSYQRLQERSQQLLRAQNAERAGLMGTGGVMTGGAPNFDEATGQSRSGDSGMQVRDPARLGLDPGRQGTEQVQTRTATGGSAPTTELGGALGSSVERGSRDLAERTNAMQAQLMSRELQGRRDQLMQALQLGAGLMTADQQRDLQRELTQIDASLRNTLGQGGLSLGLLGNLLQNQQFGQSLGAENDRFYSGLGAQMGYQQAMLNQLPFQYLFG